MRMTAALFGLVMFAVFLSATGEFNVFAIEIIEVFLKGLSPSEWGSLLVIAAAVTGAGVIISSLLGFNVGSVLTAPGVAFMIGILAAPTGAINQAGMPTVVNLIVTGFWLLLLVSGVGAALRGEY